MMMNVSTDFIPGKEVWELQSGQDDSEKWELTFK